MTPLSSNFICSMERLAAHPFFFFPWKSICLYIEVPTYYETVIKQNFALRNVTVETDSNPPTSSPSPPPAFLIALFKFAVTFFSFSPVLCSLALVPQKWSLIHGIDSMEVLTVPAAVVLLPPLTWTGCSVGDSLIVSPCLFSAGFMYEIAQLSWMFSL